MNFLNKKSSTIEDVKCPWIFICWNASMNDDFKILWPSWWIMKYDMLTTKMNVRSIMIIIERVIHVCIYMVSYWCRYVFYDREDVCSKFINLMRRPWGAIYSQNLQQTHRSGGTLLRVPPPIPEGSAPYARRFRQNWTYYFLQ